MKIEKKDYSSNPWRLIDSEGKEVCFSGPVEAAGGIVAGGMIPVMGRTKQECTEKALDLLERFLNERGVKS